MHCKKKVPVSNFRGFSGVLSPILIWKTHVFKDLNLSWVMGLSAPPPLFSRVMDTVKHFFKIGYNGPIIPIYGAILAIHGAILAI